MFTKCVQWTPIKAINTITWLHKYRPAHTRQVLAPHPESFHGTHIVRVYGLSKDGIGRSGSYSGLQGRRNKYPRVLLRISTTVWPRCQIPWFQNSAAMHIRTALFWVITQRVVATSYRRFVTTYRSDLHADCDRYVGKESPLPAA